MNQPILARRHFLQRMRALGTLALPGALSGTLAAPARAEGALKAAYDPAAKFDIKVSEAEFRRTAAGRMLMARVYQPQGAGPFPILLDLHGGAWNNKDRTANEPMDRAIAASGVLVVAIDMTLAPEAPYPASVQDANYGVRWLKSKAAGFHGDASQLGVLGSSTGGQIAELLGMRPRDRRYNAIALPGAPGVALEVEEDDLLASVDQAEHGRVDLAPDLAGERLDLDDARTQRPQQERRERSRQLLRQVDDRHAGQRLPRAHRIATGVKGDAVDPTSVSGSATNRKGPSARPASSSRTTLSISGTPRSASRNWWTGKSVSPGNGSGSTA